MGPTWLRSLGSCTRWTGLNLRSSSRRLASYIYAGSFCVNASFLVPTHPHFSWSMAWAVHDELSEAVLSGGEMWSLEDVNALYVRFALRFCSTTRFCALPKFTYIVVHSLRMNDIILLLLAHSGVLFGPSHRHLVDVLTHGTSSGEAFCHQSFLCQEWCPRV